MIAPMSGLLFSLLLLLAGGLWYLSEVDRLSTLAVTVVELEIRFGQKLWVLALVAAGVWGAVALGRAALARADRAPPRPAAAPPAPRPTAPLPSTGDWYADARRRADALPLAPTGEIRVDEGWDVPFTLRIRQATVEQTRRRLDAFAGFLTEIPTPHKARVTIESSPDITIAHHHLVNAHLKRRFSADRYYVMEHGGSVDIVFAEPDPRWAARTR